jgi:hypothetical protein
MQAYQIEGVQWLLEHYNNGLGALADDGIENIANLIYASRSTRKIRF